MCNSLSNYLSPSGPKFFGNYAIETPPFTGRIRVVTFNIAFAKRIERAIAELSSIPALRQADLLLLQEMDETGTEAIARVLNYNYVYFPASVHVRHGRNFGNAILSKWPLIDEQKIILPHAEIKRGQRRIAVAATVRLAGIDVRVCCAHTETIWLRAGKRLAQADSILQNINGHPHVIVGGDFNTFPASSLRAVDSLFRSQGFQRASEGVGASINAGIFSLRLDHIFARGFAVLDAGKQRESKASDHLPIWVDLQLKYQA